MSQHCSGRSAFEGISKCQCHLQAALAGSGAHADVVVQSTHKMLGSLTQSSMLHVRGARALRLSERISRVLQVLQVGMPARSAAELSSLLQLLAAS